MYDLNGKIAIVTGAGGRHGIGRAIATRLAGEGANVVVTDVPQSLDAIRDEDRLAGWEGLHSVAAEIEAMGRESLAIFSDVSDSDQVDDMVGQTLAKFGRIDILVNNAGSRPGKDRVLVVELEEEAFDEVMRVNVRGTYLVSRAVARHMEARSGGGKIINISSGAGKRGIARYAAYCASKFAVIGFTQAMAQEMAQHRVNVNAICPASSTPSGWTSSPPHWLPRENPARSTARGWSPTGQSGYPWAALPKATTSPEWPRSCPPLNPTT